MARSDRARKRRDARTLSCGAVVALAWVGSCAPHETIPSRGSGGSPVVASGGAAPASSGGATASGGSSGGGASSGGSSTGGAAGSAASSGERNGAGGRAGTGGAPGGGAPGVAGAGGDSLCAPGRYAVCEGFEAAAVGTNVAPAGWTRTGAVDVVADPANVYRGAHAMRVNPALNGPRRINMTGAVITGLTGSHWGRIFYKVQVPAPVSCDSCCGGVLHSTFVGLDGVGPTGGAGEYRVVDTVEDQRGMHQFLYNIQYSAGPETGRGSAYNYRYDGNWHCAEWHIDNTTSAIQFFYDGVAVTLPGNAGDFPPSFTALHVGLNNYQMACAPYLTAWIDEIALDRSRIGCGG